ncbi:MAG: DUF885 family protein [Burkholderiales bacterium]|jgi:hypothetical protein
MSASRLAAVAAAIALLLQGAPAPAIEGSPVGYDTLVALFAEWRAFQPPPVRDGIPDYTAAAMAEQHRRLPALRARLDAIDTSGFSVAQRVDWQLVRAEMSGLDFDHRVLRPWARDPAFYSVVVDSESDTPLREGPAFAGEIELWRYTYPLPAAEAAAFATRLRAIPRLLEQARGNLTGDARDLWRLGIRAQKGQSAALARLAETLAKPHPQLVPDVERARQAVDAFVAWLEQQLPAKTGRSGVGVSNYDWYLRNVQFVPMSWQDELVLMERELARSTAALKLEELRNLGRPPLEPPASAAEWQARAEKAIDEFLRFAREKPLFSVRDYAAPALRARISGYKPPAERDFFDEVDLRDPRVMRCHQVHWIDKARMREQPHASPIRRVPSLYNIWASRAEGFATGMEELAMGAGLFDDSPRSRELVYVMVAQRAARAIAGLRVHSNEWSVDEAVRFASATTPRGWFRPDGDLVWFEQQLYLQQPGYGTSYLTGKALVDDLIAERARQQGDAFRLGAFLDELFDAGMIPVSLIRWELTGSIERIEDR